MPQKKKVQNKIILFNLKNKHMNPFSLVQDVSLVQDKYNIIELTDGTILTSDNISVDYKIIKERNDSINNIYKDTVEISDISTMLSSMAHDQSDDINIINKQIDNTVIITKEGSDDLGKVVEYMKNKFIIFRDVAIVISGGILGANGFFLGPIVGVGTVVAGVAGGGAAVAGIHKTFK